MASDKTHRYRAICEWRGETASGYAKYPRAHRVTAPPAETALDLSSDPAFRGDGRKLNPEQLLVMAASSCQLLSFLAIAARAKIDVRGYFDEADGEMPETIEPIAFSRIRLQPRIEIARGVSESPSEAELLAMVRQAHEECYIASSLKSEVTVEATIVFV
jgi:organic hydroperoxide reductase OsmC/OhrA